MTARIWFQNKSVNRASLALLIFLNSYGIAIAQETTAKDSLPRYFEGLYLGTTLGIQDVLAGLSVNDAFVSTQASRLAVELVLGHRWQFINDRVTFSFEVHAGFIDANLQTSSAAFPDVSIGFSNNSQVGLGYDLGYVVDKDSQLLLYLYIRQVRRTFQITAMDMSNTIQLTSESIVSFRYGIGAEYRLSSHFHGKLSFGTFSDNLQQDFPKLPQPEASIGIVYQF